ncbi:LysR family transcriptional regulator [Burkholderia cenocepacia]|uniref:LysR family transcriptional regulator n=1 Tax=Burkholderia cenocepacia TaxID=95486 RepID=A0A3Q9F886_9BURK|nr:LysR family transcriptional regulator [Burkholderia cenocepacia]AZQ51502.1 LysR family transcriptional regulator [Burkholderia cenocepacia]
MQSTIELWQLRYFIAAAEELSFRRAAERLFITQPPLTRQIQALEEIIGARLFERDRGGVRLTTEGTYLLTEARDLLAVADATFERIGQHIAPGKHELRLGITTVLDPALFAWIEPALKRRDPALRLIQKRQYSQDSTRDLRGGSLDAALIGLPSATEGLRVERLFDDPLVAALPEGHALRKRRRISLLELAGDTLFWPQRRINPSYYDHFEKLFRTHGFHPRRVAEPTDHHVLLSLIAEGQGVALIPSSLKSIARDGVIYRELREQTDLRIEVAIAYMPDAHDASLQQLIDALRSHYRIGADANSNL